MWIDVLRKNTTMYTNLEYCANTKIVETQNMADVLTKIQGIILKIRNLPDKKSQENV